MKKLLIKPNRCRCSCRGKDGKLKKLYADYETAMNKLYDARDFRQTFLNVYECPEGLGYHLTSNQYQY